MKRTLFLFFVLLLPAGCGEASLSGNSAYAEKKKAMIEIISHYDPNYRVTDPKVLKAMEKVPRHEFVPAEVRDYAYDDRPLPIGEGQTISQPFMVAYMTQILELTDKDRVLEVGTGSGYHAAVLAEIAQEVYTIEILGNLARQAEQTLKKLKYKNINIKVGDGYRGWPEAAPFDAIIVTCAPDHIPKPLLDQLKTGGRMAIPVGKEVNNLWQAQELYLVKKTAKGLKREQKFAVRFVPMTGEAQRPK